MVRRLDLVRALTVLTLAWNPIRVLIGVRVHRPPRGCQCQAGRPRRPEENEGWSRRLFRALREPPPEEMPQVDPSLMLESTGESVDERGRGKRKKSRAELTVEHDERIAAAIDATEGDAGGGRASAVRPAHARPRRAARSLGSGISTRWG